MLRTAGAILSAERMPLSLREGKIAPPPLLGAQAGGRGGRAGRPLAPDTREEAERRLFWARAAGRRPTCNGVNGAMVLPLERNRGARGSSMAAAFELLLRARVQALANGECVYSGSSLNTYAATGSRAPESRSQSCRGLARPLFPLPRPCSACACLKRGSGKSTRGVAVSEEAGPPRAEGGRGQQQKGGAEGEGRSKKRRCQNDAPA